MQGDKKVIDALNARLSEELAAVCQYMVHSEMCANWGYAKLSSYIKRRAIDEMKHAETLIERILFLEGTPTVELGDVNIATSVPAMFTSDHESEQKTVDNYNESIAIAVSAKDGGSRELFGSILKDEEFHIDTIESNKIQIVHMGLPNYLVEQIG